MVAHKKVEASFKIVSVSVVLTRTVNNVESNIIKVTWPILRFRTHSVQVNLSNLGAKFTQRSYDMAASVALQKIEIEDCLEQTPEFKYLATSEYCGTEEALIAINFTQTQRVHIQTIKFLWSYI